MVSWVAISCIPRASASDDALSMWPPFWVRCIVCGMELVIALVGAGIRRLRAGRVTVNRFSRVPRWF